MLIAMDPNASLDIVLPGYEDEPDPPTFLCKHLTARERMRIQRLLETVADNSNAVNFDKADDAIAQIFGIALTGWKNIKRPDGSDVPFVVEDGRVKVLGDMLGLAELYALHRRIWRDTLLSEEGKKKSDAASKPTAGSSVETATAASARPETPQSSNAPPATDLA